MEEANLISRTLESVDTDLYSKYMEDIEKIVASQIKLE